MSETPKHVQEREAEVRAALAAIQIDIRERWERAYEIAARTVADGDYEGERALRAHVNRSLEPARQEAAYLEQQLPPFMVWNEAGGYYERKMVTERELYEYHASRPAAPGERIATAAPSAPGSTR